MVTTAASEQRRYSELQVEVGCGAHRAVCRKRRWRRCGDGGGELFLLRRNGECGVVCSFDCRQFIVERLW